MLTAGAIKDLYFRVLTAGAMKDLYFRVLTAGAMKDYYFRVLTAGAMKVRRDARLKLMGTGTEIKTNLNEN